MARRVAAAALLAAAWLIALGGSSVAAAVHRVAIASFNFAPPTIEVNEGDRIEWTNVDPVVHTVTAERGQFASGHLRQGQTYALTFTTPGRFDYFCETHDDMRAVVVVVPTQATEAAPARSTTTSTSPPSDRRPVVADASQSAPTTAPIPAVAAHTPPVDAGLAAPGSPLPTATAASAVTGGLVTGGAHTLPAPLVVVAVLLLGLAAMTVLWRGGMHVADAAKWVAAGLTLATGVVHAELRLAIDYPEPIATLMVIAAAASLLVAAYLVAGPLDWTVVAAGVGFHVIAIAAFVISRQGTLWGYHEVGWDPSPQAAIAIAAEAGALALMVVTALLATRLGRRELLVDGPVFVVDDHAGRP